MTYEDHISIAVSRELPQLDFSCACTAGELELCGCDLGRPCRCDGEMGRQEFQQSYFDDSFVCADCYHWTADPEDPAEQYAICMKPSIWERWERELESTAPLTSAL